MRFTKTDIEKEINREISIEEFTYAVNIATQLVEEYCGIKLSKGDGIEVGDFSSPTSLIEVKYKPMNSIYIADCLFDGYRLDEYPYRITLYKWGLYIEPKVFKYEIKYSYGYEEIPYPLEKAMLKICVMSLVKLDKPLVAVESYSSGGTTYRFLLADVSKGRPTGDDYVDSILNMYRIRRPLII